MIAAVRSCLSKRLLKYVKNIHICIRLQRPFSHKFRKTKDWLNQHNDYKKVTQDIKYKLMGLYLLSSLFKWANMLGKGVFSGKVFSVSMKINQIRVKKLRESEKILTLKILCNKIFACLPGVHNVHHEQGYLMGNDGRRIS